MIQADMFHKEAEPFSFEAEQHVWWAVDQQLPDGQIEHWLTPADTEEAAIDRVAGEIYRRGEKVAIIVDVRIEL